MKKAFIIIAIIAAVAVVGVLAAPAVPRLLPGLFPTSANGTSQSTYQVEPAVLGNITASVGATGTVRSNQTAIVTWQTSGTVASVEVAKGAVVTRSTRLAALEQTSLSQNLIMAQVDLINAQNSLKTATNNGEARAKAQLALVQAQKSLEDAQKESQSKLYQRAGQNTIDVAEANLILAEKELDRAEDIYNKNKNGTQENYAAGLSLLANARQKRDNAKYNLLYVQGLPDTLDIQEVDAKLELAKAKLQSAKLDWEKVKDGPNPDDITTAQAKIASAQATLNLTRMAAPFNGTITDVMVKPGDVVNTGTRAFQIDDLRRLLIDVQVSEVDINQVKPGQPATLAFDAISAKEYSGVVVDIASAGTTSGGSVNFLVTVEVSKPDQEIKPGMTAAVTITVSQLQDVLLIPNKAVRVLDGKRVVYVLKDNQPVAVEIDLGPSSGSSSQVLSGNVQAGDAIVLNPPSQPLFGAGGGGGGGRMFGGGG